MKIVQSFWTKPSFKKKELSFSDRNKGGWLDKKFNYMSWALSCLQLKKYYEKIELVTDEKGYDLLINKLNLPYSSVKVVLDELNDYHPDLWALGKLFAYKIQKEPFIHIDNDIFIYERLNSQYENANLIVQNYEKGFYYYEDVFKELISSFSFIPEVLYNSRQRNQQIIAVNAGVIGGNDIEFFQNYTEAAFDFVNKNIPHLDKVNTGMFNTIYEQFLFHALAEKDGKDIKAYISDINYAFDGIANFTQVPKAAKFIHTVGFYKRIRYINEILEYRLQSDFPGYFYKIMNLLRTNQI